MHTAVGVIDVGSPASGSLGWAIYDPREVEIALGSDLDEFAHEMARLSQSLPLALGFEAPLFAPFRDKAITVLKGRVGEGNRPWSAGAGAAVTAAGLGVVPYTLKRLREFAPTAIATFDPSASRTPGTILLWEAFVTASAKGTDHSDDAHIAVRAFLQRDDGGAIRSDVDEASVFNLLGAALLRTGWTSDISILAEPCLVVRA